MPAHVDLWGTRLTFQIGATDRPPYVVPLVFGWQAFHLPRCAGGRGAKKVLCVSFIWKLLHVRVRTLASRVAPGALWPVRDGQQRYSGAESERKLLRLACSAPPAKRGAPPQAALPTTPALPGSKEDHRGGNPVRLLLSAELFLTQTKFNTKTYRFRKKQQRTKRTAARGRASLWSTHGSLGHCQPTALIPWSHRQAPLLCPRLHSSARAGKVWRGGCCGRGKRNSLVFPFKCNSSLTCSLQTLPAYPLSQSTSQIIIKFCFCKANKINWE